MDHPPGLTWRQSADPPPLPLCLFPFLRGPSSFSLPVAILENEFSWSRRREDVFLACPRQYFYEYYASWGGWREDAAPRVRELYILKQLVTRPMWAGEVVHRCIQRTLDYLRRGIPPLGVEKILELVLDEMRGAFRSSRSGMYRRRPKTLALFEHEYGWEVRDEEWRETRDLVMRCLHTFYASAIYADLARLPADAWLEVEQLASFDLDGVKVWVKLDCSHREARQIRILDWKTGRISPEDQTVQLALYALYAAGRWGAAPANLKMIEYNLAHDEPMECRITEESLDEVRRHVQGSVADMRKLLRVSERNIPREEEAFELAASEAPCRRCKYRRLCPRFSSEAAVARPRGPGL